VLTYWLIGLILYYLLSIFSGEEEGEEGENGGNELINKPGHVIG